MNQLSNNDCESAESSLLDLFFGHTTEQGGDKGANSNGTPTYLFYDDEYANSNQYICSVGYVCTDEHGNELFRNYELIDPECDFGFFETQKHGLTRADVAGKMNFREFCEDTGLINLLERCIFVAHNAKGADLHHIRKSLAHYGLDMPRIRVIDTQDLASRITAFEGESLEAACAFYGIPLEEHHNALEDAVACCDIFWRMQEDLECGCNAEDYVPGVSGGRAPRRNRPNGTLGLVNGSEQTIEELLDEFDSLGLLADVNEVVELGPCAMKFSGVANGMSSSEIEIALQAKGYGSGANKTVTGKPGRRTAFFAIGDNVGASKIDAAKDNCVHVVALADFLDALDI